MPEHRRGAVASLLRTPKGQLLAVLLLLAGVAGSVAGWSHVAPGLAAAVLAALVVDVPWLRLRKGRWVFPDGALLTALIVAMILAPQEPWPVVALTAGLAVVSKYLLRAGPANVFNPAALALVATFYLFNTAQSWWGALPELPTVALAGLFLPGGYITWRVNKVPVVLAFLGVYYGLFTVVAWLGDPGQVAELYRAPDLHAALFFAFFMVTDPPTSPPRHRDQMFYGALAAIGAFVAFESFGAACFLLIGVLIANAWEGWRRWRARLRRRTPRDLQPGLPSS